MLFLVMAGVLALGSETAVQAAKVRLSKKELTLEIGNSKKITVKGTSEKITWASSDKNVATVKKARSPQREREHVILQQRLEPRHLPVWSP